MYVIDQEYNPIKNIPQAGDDRYFWIYDAEQRDFFLHRSYAWFSLRCDAYVLQIGKDHVNIPTGYHIVIGDIDGGLDSVTPDEIVGRDFDVLTFSRTLDEGSWELKPITVTGYVKNHTFVYPNMNSPFPVVVGERHAMLLSSTDLYKKVGNLGFADIA